MSAGVGGDPGIVVMLAVAVDAARFFRSSFLGLVALAWCASVLAIACSGTDDEQVEEEAPASQTQSRPAPPAQPIATEEQQTVESNPTERIQTDPVALLVSEAAALEHNGYWEQALAVRESAIAEGGTLSAGTLISLKLDRVRLLLRLDRPSDAQQALTEISGFAGADATRRHALLRARAALMLDQTDVAVEAMSDYVNSDSPAWAVMALEVARTLQRAGRGGEATEWAERALGGSLPAQDRLRAIHLAATELDIAGEFERALARYNELLRESPWRDDQAAALSRIGSLQRDRGNIEAAREAWFTLVNDYQEYAESSEALALLLDSGSEVDQLTIGIIRFHEERYVDARHAMLNALGSSGDLTEQVAGEFYIAAIHQRNGDLGSAALGYEAVISRDRSHPLAAESAMRLAEFAIADGNQLTAEEHWRRVALEHPEHRRAPEAARRWALLATARGQWSEAAQRFRDAANSGADFWGDRLRQELLLWSALMHREAGDQDTAVDLATEVVAVNPVGYYGLRASQLFDLGAAELLDLSTESWLMRLTGEANPPTLDIASLTGWQAARDLRLGGFDAAADRQLLELIEELSGDPWALADASEFMSQQGEYSTSARAAERVLGLFGLDWTEAPPALLRLAYPQPWPDVMTLHATAEGVDPLLLWSLIRRESFYDAGARGLAGEVGLTQVIPLTGSDIAAGLGIEYQHDDLARPELAIRFGAWYLKRQLEGFSNEPIMALAAYNAGPGNAARWEDGAALAGPDGFLAALDFNSTRIYVHYVIETVAVYRALAEVAQ